eukprot:COSAG03_NODE_7223_length_947_cov_1.242925_1_plen_124_part_00
MGQQQQAEAVHGVEERELLGLVAAREDGSALEVEHRDVDLGLDVPADVEVKGDLHDREELVIAVVDREAHLDLPRLGAITRPTAARTRTHTHTQRQHTRAHTHALTHVPCIVRSCFDKGLRDG